MTSIQRRARLSEQPEPADLVLDQALAQLAGRSANGDGEAFAEIYEMLAADLFRFARSMVDDASSAEDVVAETFLRAWRSARRYRPEAGTYRAWVFTIARNQLRMQWRRQRPRSESLTVAERLRTEDDGAGDDAAAVSAALARLTREERAIVVLRYFGDSSFREIAAIVGRSEGATRRTLLRALTRLRADLEPGIAGSNVA